MAEEIIKEQTIPCPVCGGAELSISGIAMCRGCYGCGWVTILDKIIRPAVDIIDETEERRRKIEN